MAKNRARKRRPLTRLRQQQHRPHHPNKLLSICYPKRPHAGAAFLAPGIMAFLFSASLLKMLRKQFFTELKDSKKLDIPLKETNEEATNNRVYTAARR